MSNYLTVKEKNELKTFTEEIVQKINQKLKLDNGPNQLTYEEYTRSGEGFGYIFSECLKTDNHVLSVLYTGRLNNGETLEVSKSVVLDTLKPYL